jgi:hypothetical protein
MIFTIDASNKQDLQQAFSIELIDKGKDEVIIIIIKINMKLGSTFQT